MVCCTQPPATAGVQSPSEQSSVCPGLAVVAVTPELLTVGGVVFVGAGPATTVAVGALSLVVASVPSPTPPSKSVSVHVIVLPMSDG
jgi:hypothetical protein